MEELIFFAIIIFFSIIDSIARSRKKRQQKVPGEAPSPAEWEWEDDELETYDEEPSYDARYEVEQKQKHEREPLPAYTGPHGSTKTEARRQPTSSEGMIPSDIWEEIAGIARGKTREPEPPAPPPIEGEQIPRRPIGTHRVHRSHAGYGTDPSSRPRSGHDTMDPLRRTLSRDARAVLRQLRSHKRSELRRAIILQEVLGPPAATRPDRFDGPLAG